MKMIKYNRCTHINHETEEGIQTEEVLTPVEMTWSEANEEIAKREADSGGYTIEEE